MTAFALYRNEYGFIELDINDPEKVSNELNRYSKEGWQIADSSVSDGKLFVILERAVNNGN